MLTKLLITKKRFALARHALIALVLFEAEFVLAAMNCPARDTVAPASSVQQIVEFIGNPVKRETVDKYAKDHTLDEKVVRANLEATGKMICGPSISTANLVMKGDIIVGVSHPLTDPETCEQKHTPADCKFKVDGQPAVAIAEVVKSGTVCPPTDKKNSDWSIYRLAKPIVGIKPYRIPERPIDAIRVDAKIALVGAMSADFKRPNPRTRKMEYAKHVQDCQIKRVFIVRYPLGFASNCDGSFGKSGGAILMGSLDDPLFIGISSGNAGKLSDLETEQNTGKPIQVPFDTETSYDAGIALTGDFLAELRKAVK